MTSIERVGMSLADFILHYDEEGPFELIDGERVAVSPTISSHTLIAKRLSRLIDQYSLPRKLGESFTEATFILEDAPNWVKGSRLPDVMFVRTERFEAFKANTPDWEEKPFIFIPDLVAEIISPTDRVSSVLKKVVAYLDDGVHIVWVIDREQRIVMVYRMDGVQLLTVNDLLDGGAVIPGFTLPVAALFE